MNQGYPTNQGYTSNPMANQYAEQPNYGQYSQPLHDKEQQQQGEVNFDQLARLGFIRKVYGILSTQLTVSLIFIIAAMFVNPKTLFKNSTLLFPMYIISVITIVITAILICCCFRRVYPANYICLGLFTLAESYILFLICATYNPQTVLIALAMTAAITFGLTIYAMTTKSDFTFCGGMLWALSFGLIVFWLLFIFIAPTFSQANMRFIYIGACMAGVVIYSIYLIYDTQLIMGKFGNEYSIDDYIFAALNLYLDIINLFLYILQILGASNSN